MRVRESKKPFPHIIIDDFMPARDQAALLATVAELDFERRESDLFSVEQTDDIASSGEEDLVAIRTRILALSPVIKKRLHHRVSHLDMSGMLYRDTDHLLCHDDQLEGRKVAYILYLTKLGKKEGGALLLRSTKPPYHATRIEPRPGRLVLFGVSPKSWHEVEEVKGKKAIRLSIGGWLYA